MAITDEEKGVWGVDKVFAKQNQGSIWDYDALDPGQLWNAGSNSKGELAQNNRTQYSSPVQVPGTNWLSVSSGSQMVLALKTDSTLWAWGSNEVGELGQNAPQNSDRSSPVQIPGTTWSKISTAGGADLAAAIRTDGSLWTWGSNSQYGNLGHNEGGWNARYSSPTQVPGTWSSIDIADYCTIGLKTNGELYTWGRNYKGALGHNQNQGSTPGTNSKSSPVQVAGDWTGSKIFGAYNGGAVKSDGTLWIWGQNDFGNLGQNAPTNSHRSSPVQIPGTTWSRVSLRKDMAAGLKTDNTLWVWGRNNDGSLGINKSGDDRAGMSSPTQLPGTTWVAVKTGGDFNIATKNDGTLWAWGGKGTKLAQNNQTYYSSPVQIPGTDWTDDSDKLTAGSSSFFMKKP